MARRSLGRSYRRLFTASTISNLGDGVGAVAWPWLASAVTRNGLLIGLVVVVQRLPWLLFSLPAGAITDRYERRRLMVLANVVRAVFTLMIAAFVFQQRDGLPTASELEAGLEVTTNVGLYVTLLAAVALLGMAEVLYDNTAQTIMPRLVAAEDLERANGRLWSTEQAMGDLAGPALGALLVAVSFTVPFVFDGLTFGLSALLIFGLPREANPVVANTSRLRDEVRTGFAWLWAHPFLKPLAITLGLLNGTQAVGTAAMVLFAQEVLHTSPLEFAIMMTGTAAGGMIGGWTAEPVSQRLGPGPSLIATLVVSGTTAVLIGLMSSWLAVWALFATSMFFAVLWNVITVSLRQRIIPDDLFGRVNSVYRFLAWGSISIGAGLGGLLIVTAEQVTDRETALRVPWVVGGAMTLLLLGYAKRHLTTAAIEAAEESAPRS